MTFSTSDKIVSFLDKVPPSALHCFEIFTSENDCGFFPVLWFKGQQVLKPQRCYCHLVRVPVRVVTVRITVLSKHTYIHILIFIQDPPNHIGGI